MDNFSPAINNLITELGKLPSIGRKSAQRLAFHILGMKEKEAKELANAILEAKQRIKLCSTCYNFTESDPCPICASNYRDTSVICIVETPRDVNAIERSQSYDGLYHVLHGTLNPERNVQVQDLKLQELIVRLREHAEIKEIIIATNPTLQGDATAIYLAKLLEPLGYTITRIAAGLPAGGDVEYTDEVTLAKALKGRQKM